MSEVYLLIGGNLGDRTDYLQKAVNEIKKNIGNIIGSSSVYETEPYGFKDERQFLNQCLLVETSFSPMDVLQRSRKIESSLGRIRKPGKYESRTMDIDILFYNERIINEIDLIIPHPELHKRNFALIPMSEINSGFIHPVLGEKIYNLLKKSPDSLKVVKYSDALT